MKIKKIEVYQVDLPYAGGTYKLSGGRSYTSFDSTIVRMVTECGLEGWGESTPFGSNYIAAHALGVRAGIAEIAPQLLGADPRHVDRINDRMNQALVGHNHAKTPLDVACWDIFGKSIDMPVCDLLGGRIENRLPVISSIGSGDPEDMRSRVAAHRVEGYMGHSIKVGALESEGGPTLDAERITASLADRKPGEFFLVDANGGLSPENALRMLASLPPNVDFVLEAPCATWRETQSLRQRCNVPIILDELAQTDADIIKLIADDVADGIGLKISKNGGLTAGRRHRDICIAAGLSMSVQDTWGSDISIAAITHLGQTVPPSLLRCVLDTRNMVNIKTAKFDAPIIDGGIVAPNEAGLGIEVDREVLGEPVAVYESCSNKF